MGLAVGTRLGPYEILAPIGAGGMGEVYRARDTKLKRDVALKVLPDDFALDPERMARFQREAEVLASLNHPNIAQIYGVEERALVMELVEGESPKGAMPFDETWKIASQIAAGLEYAHERGIVHRDLKPANIKITPDGIVKLLDFGLAKAFTGQTATSVNPENSPTLTIGATQLGVILGTAAYMAPEQAKGKTVDKRADIWSFGVVLYELLTGERLFTGDDISDTLAQVLTKQPDFKRVPVKARLLLQRCLERDPRQRLRDIGDASCLVEKSSEAVKIAPLPSRFGLAGWLTAVIAVIALGGLSWMHFREAPAPLHTLRYTIAPPENTTNIHSFAISPDGTLLAIAATVNGKRQLWLRSLDSLQAHAMPFTEGATYPFWSPDSRYIGFFGQGKLKKIAASGGPAQTLCNVANGRGGSWSRGNVIVFSPGIFGSTILQQVSADGGTPSDVPQAKGSSPYPVFLPDGRHFVYVEAGREGQSGVYLGSLEGKDKRRLLPDLTSVALAPGRLLFVRENILMEQPFDPARMQITGEAVPVAEGISVTENDIYALVTVSDTGVLVYERGGAPRGNQMAWYDRSGKLLETLGPAGRVWEPAISPDEKTVAFRRGSGGPGNDIWLRDLARGSEQRLTTDPSNNVAPFWSPHGDLVVFNSNRGGRFNLYEKAIGANGPDKLLLENGNTKAPTQWSRDGQFIVYRESDPRTKFDIWVLPMDGPERKPQPFVHSESDELFGQLSPDNHWMAYTSDESGQREVYVRPFPDGNGRWKISIAGGEQPRWRGDGKELFFVGADEMMMAVAVVKAIPGNKPLFEPGTPQPLFEAYLAQSAQDSLFEYDVTADGKRFLLDIIGGGSAPLTAVVNWQTGLQK